MSVASGESALSSNQIEFAALASTHVGVVTSGRVHYDFIDGIRAIAVTLVVLFHFDLLELQGGFLGVDMFFVISGFLVSDLILRNIADGKFALLGFFERRVYRILPALYASLILVLVTGYFILLPADFEQTAIGARASSLFFANIHFHQTIEYFNQGSQFWMLLHHWSLSVEEQFYLVFPFALVILSALKVRLNRVMPVLLLCAFLYSVSLSYSAPSAAFYLAPARFWEFLVGAQIALLPRTFKLPLRLAEILSAAAIITILLSAWLVDDPSELYGLSIALPVVATGLIIWANINTAPTVVANILSIGWIRKIGIISYSLYILHWPFILFAQYWAIEPLTLPWRIAILFVTVGASWISWRYVEQPFRKISTMDVKMRRVGILSIAATTVVIVSVASWIAVNKGFPSRQSKLVSTSLSASNDFSPERKRCHSQETTKPIVAEAACVFGPATTATMAVWSDSHGVELAYALGGQISVRGRSLVQLSSSGCPPLTGYNSPTVPKCRHRNDAVLAYLRRTPQIKHVVLTFSNAYFRNSIPTELDPTIQALRRMGKVVIFVAPIPKPPFNVPHAKARNAYFNFSQRLDSFPRSNHKELSGAILDHVNKIPSAADFAVVDPADTFCDNDKCYASQDGHLLYFDDNHPSISGAKLIAKQVIKAIP
jgi:peptidoglycan/LPS O-acetylase OafA/YrhL